MERGGRSAKSALLANIPHDLHAAAGVKGNSACYRKVVGPDFHDTHNPRLAPPRGERQ